MGELIGPIMVMVGLAGVVGVASWWAAKRGAVAIAIGVAAAAVLVAWGVWLADSLLLVRIAPVRDALVWLNPQPLAAGALAGVARRSCWTGRRTARRDS